MNIILLTTDQQRRDSLPAYGNTVVQAPNIEGLAARGMIFDNAFTTTPICGPARASMLTGLYPRNHGILRNSESGCLGGKDFDDEPFLFNMGLNDRGYTCHHIGKWHVGTELEPEQCGWRGVFYPGYGYPSRHPHYLQYLETLGVSGFNLRDQVHARYTDGSQGPLLSAEQEGGAEASVPHYLVSQAIDAIRMSVAKDEEFFVRCDFWGPHVPYIIPEEYLQMYNPKDIPEPASFVDTLAEKPLLQRQMKEYWGVQGFAWDEWSRLVAASYGYISLIDSEVGRILKLVEDLGIEEDTAVFLTSDHGGMVGSHGLCDKGPYLYDDICRIPLIAAVPGCDPGRRSDAVAYNMDLCPTFLDLAGCNVPNGMDACSLMPILNATDDRIRDDIAYLEFYGHQVPVTQKVVRGSRFKYIFNSFDKDEYYDLENDPDELVNLIGSPSCAAQVGDAREIMLDRLEALSDPILRYYRGTRMHGAVSLH
jgi:arylsulfatase A-like enzyme